MTDRQTEFKTRLKWISERLRCDHEDLLDWYKGDVDDINAMQGKVLIEIVREYINLRRHYRGGK